MITRFLQPLRRHRRPAPLVEIRPITVADVDVVLELWAEDGREHFAGNLSYDRWGPGVPVPYDDIAEADTQTSDPRIEVREHLLRLAEHPDTIGLLAHDNEEAAGFLTASLRPVSPISHATVGWIEQLYVRPSSRRRGIATFLVDQATEFLRQQGATIFRVDVAPSRRAAIGFWNQRNDFAWDARTYRSYD